MRKSVRTNGFTLLELMVALVVVSILLTVGLPSFSASVRQNCTITAANTLLTALTAARSEALKRDRTVTLCKSADGENCGTGATVSWAQGFLMYVDSDGDGVRDGSETAILAEAPLTTCAEVTGTSHFVNRMTYNGLGKPNIGGSFTVVANRSTSLRRRVVISPTGRPRVCDPDKAPVGNPDACGSTP